MTQHLDLEAWSCPMPLRDHPNVVMGHGGGGTLSSELVTHLFLPAYGDDGGVLAQLGDAAVLAVGGARIAMSTDSFVVRPRFFPGGNIGDLAVNGTVNDVTMAVASGVIRSWLGEAGDLPDRPLVELAQRWAPPPCTPIASTTMRRAIVRPMIGTASGRSRR